MNEQFYTAEEAMKVLDKPRSTFFKEVSEGIIPSILESGKRRGRKFPKEAIDLHAKLEKKHKAPKTKRTFTTSTNSDIWIAIENAKKIYDPNDIIPYEKWLQWRFVNDEMTVTMRENGINAAYASLMPIDENVIIDLVNDKIRERDIPDTAIRQWTDPNLSIYLAGITVVPSGNETRDVWRGEYLLAHTIRWAKNVYQQYDIKNFYGIGTTEKGQSILERLGFTEINSLENGNRKGYILEENMKKTTRLAATILEAAQNANE
jgi:hypothetical protein